MIKKKQAAINNLLQKVTVKLTYNLKLQNK